MIASIIPCASAPSADALMVQALTAIGTISAYLPAFVFIALPTAFVAASIALAPISVMVSCALSITVLILFIKNTSIKN